MDILLLAMAIMAIVAMAIYLLVKFCQSQGPSDAFSATVNFTIIVAYKRTEDGVIVSGAVENEPIRVGDVFRVVDRNDRVIAEHVKVKSIQTIKGFAQSQEVNEAAVGVPATLDLISDCDTINDKMFLKK